MTKGEILRNYLFVCSVEGIPVIRLKRRRETLVAMENLPDLSLPSTKKQKMWQQEKMDKT